MYAIRSYYGYGGLAWLGYSTAFIRMAAILARRAKNRPVKLIYDESNFYLIGDDAGTSYNFV